MKFLLIGLILIVVSGCKVLTEHEAIAVCKTLELQKMGWEKLEKGDKAINTFVLKAQCEEAQKLIKEALND